MRRAEWKATTVGDVLQLEYGKPLAESDRTPDGRYVVYGANGEKDRTDKFLCEEPSIIVGRKGSAGELNLTEPKFWPLDVTYFVTFDKRQHDLRFLFYLLTTLELPSLAKGVKPGLNRNEVYSQPTRVPPLIEQRRIVAVLDEAFEGIATAKASAEQNLRNACALFESYLEIAFTRRGQGWVEKRLGECVHSISTGPFGSLLHKSDYEDGGTPLVNPINIQGGELRPDVRKAIGKSTARRLAAYALREGDVVVGRRGEIGRCAVVAPQQAGWLCGTGCFFIRPSGEIEPLFLAHLLRSRHYRQRLESVAGRATMLSISNNDLSNLSIRLPSPTQQRRTVALLKGISAETQQLESLYRRKLTALDELKKSILHRAFSGQLGATP